jgi:hypothetical protein
MGKEKVVSSKKNSIKYKFKVYLPIRFRQLTDNGYDAGRSKENLSTTAEKFSIFKRF